MVSAQNLPVFPFHSGGKSASFLQLPHMVSRGISPCPNSLWSSWGWCWLLAVPKHTKATVPVPLMKRLFSHVCLQGCRHSLHCGLYSDDILAVRPLTLYIPYPTLLIFTFSLLTSLWCILTCSMVFPPYPHHPTTHTQMLGNKGFYGIKGFDYIQVSS